MDSACICLRSSSSLLTRSVSAVIPNSSPFCSNSCWSIRSRSKSCSRSLGSAGAPEESGWRDSFCNCSWLRRRSARVMMLLLMRTTISSTTVSSWPADGLVCAMSQGAATNVASKRTANFFIKYLGSIYFRYRYSTASEAVLLTGARAKIATASPGLWRRANLAQDFIGGKTWYSQARAFTASTQILCPAGDGRRLPSCRRNSPFRRVSFRSKDTSHRESIRRCGSRSQTSLRSR